MAGSFGDGFKSGAISGAITGGIYGGISAAESKWERNIIFGNTTKEGKIAFIKYLAHKYNVYKEGVNTIYYDEITNKGGTRPTLARQEGITIREAVELGAGIKSNIHMNLSKSMNQIHSSFLHEFNHASDLYLGIANRIYNNYGKSLYKTVAHLEMRSYIVNYHHGYRSNWYSTRVNLWRQGINNYSLFKSLIQGLR